MLRYSVGFRILRTRKFGATNYITTLNSNITTQTGRINVYVGSDGKIHFVNNEGADSALNFSNKTLHVDKFSVSSDGLTAWYNFGNYFSSWNDFVANARWSLIQRSDERYLSFTINQSGSISTEQVSANVSGTTYTIKAVSGGAYRVYGNLTNFIVFAK